MSAPLPRQLVPELAGLAELYGGPAVVAAALALAPPEPIVRRPWSPIEDGVLRLLVELGYGAAWASAWFPDRTEAAIASRITAIKGGSIGRPFTDWAARS